MSSRSTKTAPYGAWKSPITSDLIVAQSISLSEVRLDGGAIYWVEGRPQEEGHAHPFDLGAAAFDVLGDAAAVERVVLGVARIGAHGRQHHLHHLGTLARARAGRLHPLHCLLEVGLQAGIEEGHRLGRAAQAIEDQGAVIGVVTRRRQHRFELRALQCRLGTRHDRLQSHADHSRSIHARMGSRAADRMPCDREDGVLNARWRLQ